MLFIERLNEITKRLYSVTPGKWTHFQEEPEDLESKDVRVCLDKDNKCIGCLVLLGDPDSDENIVDQMIKDAEFIANAPEDIQWLLDRVIDAHDKIAEMSRIIQSYSEGWKWGHGSA